MQRLSDLLKEPQSPGSIADLMLPRPLASVLLKVGVGRPSAILQTLPELRPLEPPSFSTLSHPGMPGRLTGAGTQGACFSLVAITCTKVKQCVWR